MQMQPKAMQNWMMQYLKLNAKSGCFNSATCAHKL